MTKPAFAACAIASLFATMSWPAAAQQPETPAQRIASQREALSKLSFLDGVWRGPASAVLPNGSKHESTQTERVGPFLDGSVKVIEGKGYDASGAVTFNAFGTISYNATRKEYVLHSYAQGYVGDYPLTPTADGFVWEIAAGPMTMRYTATVKDGVWSEIGDRIVPGKEPVRIFQMTLKRVGDTQWPAAGAITP
jgi:hypothetical protein